MIALALSQYRQRTGGSRFYRYCVVTEKEESKATQEKDSMGTTMVGAQRKAWCSQHPINRATPRRQQRIQNVSTHDARSVWGTFGVSRR